MLPNCHIICITDLNVLNSLKCLNYFLMLARYAFNKLGLPWGATFLGNIAGHSTGCHWSILVKQK